MSASHLKPDIEAFTGYVGFVPMADIALNGGFMFFHAEYAHALCVRGDLLVELYQVVFG